jgi:hypothetical protein
MHSYSCKFLQPCIVKLTIRQAQEKNQCKISFSLRKRKLENTIKKPNGTLPSVFFFNWYKLHFFLSTIVLLMLISSQIHNNNTNIVRAIPSQGQLGQQNWRIWAGLIRAPKGAIRTWWWRWLLGTEAHSHNPTSSVIWHHIPQSITCQYQTLILLHPFRHSHFRFRYDVGLQVIVTWWQAKKTWVHESSRNQPQFDGGVINQGAMLITYGSRHGQNTKDSWAIPINYTPTSFLDSKQFIWSIRL